MIARLILCVALLSQLGCSSEVFKAESDGGATDGAAILAPGTIPCGSAACHPPAETCCVPGDVNAGSLAALITSDKGTCVPVDTCLPPAVSLRCKSPSFCATQTKDAVCCVDHVDLLFTTTECVAPAACIISGPSDILCDPSANICPTNHETCGMATNFPGLDVFRTCL